LGWKTPLLDANTQAQVDEALVREVEKEYIEKEKARRQAKKRMRSLSDSSNSSEADNFEVPAEGKKKNYPRHEGSNFLSSFETIFP
jgi:hypothetical protein